jgi:hypothetical protein
VFAAENDPAMSPMIDPNRASQFVVVGAAEGVSACALPVTKMT